MLKMGHGKDLSGISHTFRLCSQIRVDQRCHGLNLVCCRIPCKIKWTLDQSEHVVTGYRTFVHDVKNAFSRDTVCFISF